MSRLDIHHDHNNLITTHLKTEQLAMSPSNLVFFDLLLYDEIVAAQY
jgi:hypothetical protein